MEIGVLSITAEISFHDFITAHDDIFYSAHKVYLELDKWLLSIKFCVNGGAIS